MGKAVAQFTNKFLDLSETFIYEPLQIMKKYSPTILCFKRRHKDLFPYKNVYCLEDNAAAEKKQLLLGAFGRETYFSNIIKEKNIQVLQAHYGFGGIYALQFKRKNPHLKIMVNFYGLDVYQHTRSPFYRWQLRQLFKQADLFMACSKHMRKDLIKLGAPADKTFVQYGGANLNSFVFSYPAQTAEIVFLMCGRFVEKKGFEYGIKAFISCCEKYNNITLKIIGSGSLEQQLKSIAQQSSFTQRIHFLGAKTHKEYISEINKAHIFMSPSVTANNGDREGLPTVLIESAALGRPLIATNYAGIPEILHDQKNGFLTIEKNTASIAQAIEKMINSKKEWNNFADYGRKLVEKCFNLQKNTEMLEHYYDELCKGAQ